MFRSEFTCWSIRTWLNYLQRRGGLKKGFLYCAHRSYIARQRVVTTWQLRRAHLPRWKLTRYALDYPVWIGSWWQRRQERETCGVLYGRESNVHRSLSRKGLRRIIAQNCIVAKQLERTSKHNILVWFEGCSEYRIPVLTNAIILCNTLLAMCIEKVVIMNQEKNCTAKRINHRKELYWSRTWIVNARTLQALTRERPSITLRNTEERTGKRVAVKWTSESNDWVIQLSNYTITSVNRQSRNWFISSRVTWTKKQYKKTYNKSAGSIRSARSRRKWSTAWETWNSLRFAGSIQTSRAPTVWHTGRKVEYTAHAEHAYNFQTKFENSTVTATMFCQFPIMSSKRFHPTGDDTRTRKERMYYQAKFASRTAKKKYKSIQDRILRCFFFRQSRT